MTSPPALAIAAGALMDGGIKATVLLGGAWLLTRGPVDRTGGGAGVSPGQPFGAEKRSGTVTSIAAPAGYRPMAIRSLTQR